MRLSHLPKPMLSTASDAAELARLGPDEWVFEMKWDGFRIIAGADADGAVLVSRGGVDQTATFPEVAEAVARVAAALGSAVVLDGEVVAFGDTGRPDFGRLQHRAGVTDPREVAPLMRNVPVAYLAFDLLEAADRDLAGERFDQRRRALELVLADEVDEVLRLPPTAGGDFAAAWAASGALGLEGIVAKRADAPYTPGRRSRSWLKRKHERAQSVVIVGWRPGQGVRSGTVGSLLTAVPDAVGALRYTGRVGTGFTERMLRDATLRLAPLAVDAPTAIDVPDLDAVDARWVDPRLVGEVAFAEWSGSGRLRHPVWRGWRDDLEPTEVTRET